MIKPEFGRWFADFGDSTHRLNYDLNKDSVYIDVGAYIGDFAKKIHDKFNCRVYCFEPLDRYFQQIPKTFAGTNNVEYYCIGLGNKNENVEMNVDNDASSAYKKGQQLQLVSIRKIDDVFNKLDIKNVDLIKINIEGAEYDLLDYVIEKQLHKNMKNIQVQFHDFYPDAYERREQIRNALKETHELTYDYAFVWENWRLK